MIESVEPSGNNSGVKYSLYKGVFDNLNVVNKGLTPFEFGESKSIQLPQFKTKTNDLKEPFAVIFEGFINAPEDAIYEFFVEADDNAVFYIGNNEEAVAGNDKSQPKIDDKGVVPLRKGFHKFRFKYIQRGENAVLNLRWGMKGQGLRRIYGGELFH
jgi:hexosaminidase